ncbi:hypothetical protein ACFPPD_17270 [Cohnella suwonensis]|uniref:Lipoprotein n=1 Tax=Cohnella suwonensis TaxID=696072 RepID=A0ABW0LXL2_9BACL
MNPKNKKNALSMSMIALIVSIGLSACSGGGGGNEKNVSSPPSEEATASPQASVAEARETAEASAPAGGEQSECGEQLLDKIPAAVPFPDEAVIVSVCEDANEYGSGIAVRYQWKGDAKALAKTYRDALEGEYEYGGMDVLDFVTMQFIKGEEAIMIEIDASGQDSKIVVNLSYGVYPGGADKALGDVLGDIMGDGESGTE